MFPGPKSALGPLGDRRAFTLIELMLVMTILIIVISVAAPTLANFFRGRSLDSEARRLLALTRYGQGRAVSEGVPMLLWVDTNRRTYGLEEEPGYVDVDTKAVEFTLDDNVQIEAPNTVLFPTETTTVKPGTSLNASGALGLANRVNPAALRSPHANLPAIRFLPDGSFGETSPQALRLTGRDGVELWLAQTRYRLNYEIRNQITQYYEVVR